MSKAEPVRQIGRVDNETWAHIRAGAQAAEKSLVKWALPILAAQAKADLRRKPSRKATERAPNQPQATPPRALGRVDETTWAMLKAAAAHRRQSFTTWAVAILKKASTAAQSQAA